MILKIAAAVVIAAALALVAFWARIIYNGITKPNQ